MQNSMFMPYLLFRHILLLVWVPRVWYITIIQKTFIYASYQLKVLSENALVNTCFCKLGFKNNKNEIYFKLYVICGYPRLYNQDHESLYQIHIPPYSLLGCLLRKTDKPSVYFDGNANIERPCAPGTIFNERACTCVQDVDIERSPNKPGGSLQKIKIQLILHIYI